MAANEKCILEPDPALVMVLGFPSSLISAANANSDIFNSSQVCPPSLSPHIHQRVSISHRVVMLTVICEALFCSGFGAVTSSYCWLGYFLQHVEGGMECVKRIVSLKKERLLMAQRIRYYEELHNDDSLCRYLLSVRRQRRDGRQQLCHQRHAVNAQPRGCASIEGQCQELDARGLKERAQQLHGADSLHRHHHLYRNLEQLYAMTAYCVYKMATSAGKMALHRRRRLDSITRTRGLKAVRRAARRKDAQRVRLNESFFDF